MVFSFISCRSDQGRVYWVDEERKVQLAFDAQAESDLSSYVLNVIGPNGERTRAKEFNLSSDKLQFILENDLILNESHHTKAENIVAMGDELPPYSERVKAVARVEIRKESLEGNSGKTSYVQFPIPLLQSDLLAAKQELKIDNSIKLEEVAYQTIKVSDLATGNPIEGAAVLGIVNDYIPKENNELESIWRSSLFRPIIHQTDAAGLTALLPLKNVSDNSNFTVIAYAKGYCTYVSEAQKYSSDNIPEIKLRECSFADENTVGFVVNFDEDELTYTDNINSEDRIVAYTPLRVMRIRIDSYSPMMRGLKIRFTETYEIDGGENAGSNIIKLADNLEKYSFKFASELNIDLPILFQYNGTTNGEYIVRILGEDVDLAENVEDRLKAHMYGSKNTDAPSIEFASDIKIKGLIKENVLSGKTDSEFYVSTRLCTSGFELGVGEVFKPCDENGQATFTIGEISLVNQSNEIGGNETLKVFLKNRYKIISKDDQLERNHFQVFIDYGDPTFESMTIGTDFGFANSDAQKGSDDFPYVYPIGILSGGSTNTMIVSKNSLSNTVLRFPSAAKCVYKGNAVKEGSTSGDNTGITVETIGIAASESGLNDASFVSCLDGESARDIPLETRFISFPSDSSGEAEFYLMITDSVGHRSTATRFTIPACPENVTTTEGTAFCWQE